MRDILGTPIGVKALRCFAPARPHTETVRGPQYLNIQGRYVSVALSFELPRQDVILHLALVKPGLSSPVKERPSSVLRDDEYTLMQGLEARNLAPPNSAEASEWPPTARAL